MPLAAQSREEPEPYSFPGEDDQWLVLPAISHGGIVDGHFLAVGQVQGPTAFGSRRELLRRRMLAKVPRIITS